MDGVDIAFALLSVLCVVIGAALTVILDIVRGQVERGQRRQENRDNVQRWFLIELQDAMDALASHTGELKLAMDRGDEAPEIRESQRQAEAKVILLNERIEGDSARGCVEKYLISTRLVIVPATTAQERGASLVNTLDPFNAANTEIGKLIRAT